MKSKKRSAASSKLGRRSQPTLFLDRSLGRHSIATALRIAGAIVEVHDHFKPDAPDEEWLRIVGQRQWVVLTKDARIRRRPNEIDALTEANVIAIVLTAGNMTGAQMAALFARHPQRILRRIAEASPPALFTFGRDGRLLLWRH